MPYNSTKFLCNQNSKSDTSLRDLTPPKRKSIQQKIKEDCSKPNSSSRELLIRKSCHRQIDKKKRNSLKKMMIVKRFIEILREKMKKTKENSNKTMINLIGDNSYFEKNQMNLKENLMNNIKIFGKIMKKIQLKLEFLALNKIFQIFLLINTAIYFVLIPLQLGFALNFLEKSMIPFVNFTIFLSISLFFIDIFSGFFRKNQLFLKDFLQDFLSILYILLSFFAIKPNIYTDLLSFFFIFRIKNLRILLKSFEEFGIKSRNSSIFFNIFLLTIKVLYFSHIFACLWHFIGFFNTETARNWLEFKGISNEKWTIRYVESLYFIVGILNKNGFDNNLPINPLEKVFCIIVFYSSTAIFAYILMNLVIILKDFIKEKADFLQFFNEFLEFSQRNNIDEKPAKKIKNFIETRFSEEKLHNSNEKIANCLSKPLKDLFLIKKNLFLLKKIRIFSKNFSENSLKKLANEMSEIQYFPEDLIYKEGDSEVSRLFIVLKGEIELFLQSPKKEKILKNIINNGFFGEISLFSHEMRETSAKSKGFSTLLSIRKDDFLRILKENSEDYEKYCEIKEKILINGEFNDDLSLKCDTCSDKNHLKFNCVLERILSEKSVIIAKFNDSKPQIRRKFKRKRDKKQKALNFVMKLRNLPEKFLMKNEEIKLKTNEEDSSEESLLEICDKLPIITKGNPLRKNSDIYEQNLGVFERNFEKMMNFRVFFIHNNIDEILQKVNFKRKRFKKQFFLDKNDDNSFASFMMVH